MKTGIGKKHVLDACRTLFRKRVGYPSGNRAAESQGLHPLLACCTLLLFFLHRRFHIETFLFYIPEKSFFLKLSLKLLKGTIYIVAMDFNIQ